MVRADSYAFRTFSRSSSSWSARSRYGLALLAASETLSFVLAMFGGSFRLAARASLPLALLFILSACGGSTTTTASPAQGVRGTGFTIEAPAGWQVARTARVVTARRGSALVSVSVFPLVKAYDPAIFDRAAKELDGVARRLAERAGGTITESKTTT